MALSIVPVAKSSALGVVVVGGVGMLVGGRIGARAPDVETESGCWEVSG